MPDQPNVLMISTDHWPGRMIGGLGHPTVMTPTLDQFMANGVTFTNAYSLTPMCVPARRSMLTGTSARTHGDRFQGNLPYPDIPTVASAFRDAGYQAFGVGKMHSDAPRRRLGFDDVLTNEEGRNYTQDRSPDDYEMFVTEQGFPGLERATGLHNHFDYRPWHLPEHCHPTNWTAREMSRQIARRDPDRPSFWYMSFTAPHPPFIPLEGYMDMYRDVALPPPLVGEWSADPESLPIALRSRPWHHRHIAGHDRERNQSRRAFYALATHVDHQIMAVVGSLFEQGIQDDTIILFTSDHGDMEGNHGMWNKMVFYEGSAKIPMVVVGSRPVRERIGFGRTDDRLVAQPDIMPTLLDLCDVPIPETVDGVSMFGERRHDHLYGEFWENAQASRMVRNDRYKLIWYAAGNHTQLFDMLEDPDELVDVSADPSLGAVRSELRDVLVSHLYGSDVAWLRDGELIGMPEAAWTPEHDYDLTFAGQRGYRFR